MTFKTPVLACYWNWHSKRGASLNLQLGLKCTGACGQGDAFSLLLGPCFAGLASVVGLRQDNIQASTANSPAVVEGWVSCCITALEGAARVSAGLEDARQVKNRNKLCELKAMSEAGRVCMLSQYPPCCEGFRCEVPSRCDADKFCRSASGHSLTTQNRCVFFTQACKVYICNPPLPTNRGHSHVTPHT
jgi:hypothetical protein